MVSRMTSSIHRVSFPWHAPWSRFRWQPVLYHAPDQPTLGRRVRGLWSIIEGMDVVNKIAETATDYSDRPLEEQKMKKVTVETFGVDYPEPEKC